MKIAITCPYSYNFRNVVLSGLVEEMLQEGWNVDIFIPPTLGQDEYLISLKSRMGKVLKIYDFEPVESKFVRFLSVMMASWKYNIQGTKTFKHKARWLRKKSFFQYVKYCGIGLIMPRNAQLYKKLESVYRKIFFNLESHRLTTSSAIDIYIGTLLHKYDELHYAMLAQEKGAKIVNLIHSWDVITTKGFFPCEHDLSLFWSSTNKLEYQRYITTLFSRENEKTEVCGPVQFDKYGVDGSKESEIKARGYERRAIDKNQTVILYSTSVGRLVPHEEKMILKIIEIIKDFKSLYLLVRIHPQAGELEFRNLPERGANFQAYRPEKYDQNLIDGVRFDKTSIDGLMEDVLTSSLTINYASSMALDSYALNRKCVWLNTDLSSNTNEFYRYEHVKSAIDDLNIDIITDSESLKLIFSELNDGCFESEGCKTKFEKNYGEIGQSRRKIIKQLSTLC